MGDGARGAREGSGALRHYSRGNVDIGISLLDSVDAPLCHEVGNAFAVRFRRGENPQSVCRT